MGKIIRVRAFAFFFLFSLSSTLLVASANQLKHVRLIKNEIRLTFSQDYDKNKIKHFRLEKPCRQVFDFPNVHLVTHDFFNQQKKIKIAQYKPDIVRLVITSTTPYSCAAYQPIFMKKEYHIPLPYKDKISSRTTTKPHKKRKIHIVLSERSEPKKKPIVYNVPKKSTPIHSHELIVIDAGHGGHDSGAIGGKKKEKVLVLSIAKKVAKALKRRGYPVYLTRHSDRFLKLSQRTHIADKKASVAFISIHANSVPKRQRNSVHGVETFFLQNTRDAKSQRIAARENAAVLKGAGTNLSKHVIIDSVLNGPKIVQSNKLAIDVQRRIITNLRSRYRGVKDAGVRHAPFYVLVGASRPSILVEVGYISHPKERKRLFTSTYQNLLAKGIAEGVDNYLNNRRKEIEF